MASDDRTRGEKKSVSDSILKTPYSVTAIILLVIAISIIVWFSTPYCPEKGRNLCIVEKAKSTNNSELCEKILFNEDMRTWCYTDIAVKTGESSVCSEITNTKSKEFCMKDLAVKLNNTEVCSSLNGSVPRSECYNRIARKKNKWRLCNEMSDEDLSYKNSCLRDLAEKVNKIKPCLEIQENSSKKDICLLKTSISAESERGCGLIEESGQRAVCYLNLAIHSGNKTLCNKTRSEGFYKECLSKVEE